MTSTTSSLPVAEPQRAGSKGVTPGLVLVAAAVGAATFAHELVSGVPFIVAAVLAGVVMANTGMVGAATQPGLGFASTTVLRFGIVLLGLRLSVGDVAGLGVGALVVIVLTVSLTFFGVQIVGRRLGLSPALSLLVASGFSICGNSAIASVKGVSNAEDEEVAAAVGLVTLCGTLAIVVVPALGSVFGLGETQLGVWTGASVQDTAQVIAVASAAGPAVLVVATAVKLTRVLFLAPIVAGVSMWNQRQAADGRSASGSSMFPPFVVGFLAALLIRTTGLVPSSTLAVARSVEQYALGAGMVGLGSSVRVAALRQLGIKPLALGAIAWLVAGGVSLGSLALFVA